MAVEGGNASTAIKIAVQYCIKLLRIKYLRAETETRFRQSTTNVLVADSHSDDQRGKGVSPSSY